MLPIPPAGGESKKSQFEFVSPSPLLAPRIGRDMFELVLSDGGASGGGGLELKLPKLLRLLRLTKLLKVVRASRLQFIKSSAR